MKEKSSACQQQEPDFKILKFMKLTTSSINFRPCKGVPGDPLTYFNDGGIRVIFLGQKFWPKVIF